MKSFIKFVLVISILAFSPKILKAQHIDSSTKNYKVVFQLSSNDSLVHKSFVKQMNNLLNAMNNVTIEVVTHGPGVEFLLNKSVYKNSIKRLTDQGVIFLVCQNTLNEKKINTKELLWEAKVIPAGLAHIIARQSDGWSYVKVGF